MTDHFRRSQVLLNQGRYDLAEKELRLALSFDPDYASAHGLLAICLSERKQYSEAIQEIGTAIALSPDYAGFHYIYAGILREQRKLDAAKNAILEALRLDPEDADFYARLASIQYDQAKYAEALKSTEQGLSLDAEHVWSMNMRLLTLIELGRISDAEAEVNSTLAIAPEHPFPHTVKGWVLLHQTRIPEAMHSFREALRIKPDQEWARLGLLEALKARNGLYRLILRVELWRSRLTTAQRAVFVALLIIPQTRALFLFLLIFIGLAKYLFTFLLWFDPYGRLALNQKEIAQNKWVLAILLSLILSILLYGTTQQPIWAFIVPSILPAVYCVNRLWFSHLDREEIIKFCFLLPISCIPFLFVAALALPMQAEAIVGIAGGFFALTITGFLLFVVGLFLHKLARVSFSLRSKK
jgi:tetratricopeptide (TPR) repeat protein